MPIPERRPTATRVLRGLAPLLALALLLSACAAPSAAPSAAPPTAAPVPPTGSAASAEAWEAQWNALLAAARQEGKVVVLAPPTPELRAALPAAFQRRFGIELEYSGASSTEFATRLITEADSGIYWADVALGGVDSMYRTVAAEGKIVDGAMGLLAPLRPALLLPEVTDPANYRSSKLRFVDPAGQYLLSLTNFVNSVLTVNTQEVPLSSLTSWQDLLRPEYRGRIVAHDPTGAGSGVVAGTYLYETFGPDYAKALFLGQDALLSRDQRQAADLIARGVRPIGLGIQEQEASRLVREGFPTDSIPGLPDGPGYMTAGSGILGVLAKAPHPNAARVFANWIASREGSQIYQDGHRQLSTRNDLDVSTFDARVIPSPGVPYMDMQDWGFVVENRTMAHAQTELRQLLGR